MDHYNHTHSDHVYCRTRKVLMTDLEYMQNPCCQKEKMMLFEVAVLHKNEEKKENVAVPIQSLLAKDIESAKRKAIKLVPADTDLDEVTVLVRPFA